MGDVAWWIEQGNLLSPRPTLNHDLPPMEDPPRSQGHFRFVGDAGIGKSAVLLQALAALHDADKASSVFSPIHQLTQRPGRINRYPGELAQPEYRVFFINLEEPAGVVWQPPTGPGSSYTRLSGSLPDLFASAAATSRPTPPLEQLFAAMVDRSTRRSLARKLTVSSHHLGVPVFALAAVLKAVLLRLAVLLSRCAAVFRTTPLVRPPGTPNFTSPHRTRGPDRRQEPRVLPITLGATPA
ncbi:hypothetical protein [Catenuloplanes japonicus]|uniref:hypothetical protein n=1 Tax=Catenuloplanes japonicus TaxID=33876 RepID=UPI000A93B6DB|nr:hypothetical protein [Catenuloplanes japonicus]